MLLSAHITQDWDDEQPCPFCKEPGETFAPSPALWPDEHLDVPDLRATIRPSQCQSQRDVKLVNIQNITLKPNAQRQ